MLDWLNVSLPLGIIFLSLFIDLVRSVPIPNPLRAAYRFLSAPFRNFLALDDLLEPVDRTPKSCKTENKSLVVLAGIQFLGWTSSLAYAVTTENHPLVIQSLLYTISWVCVAHCCMACRINPLDLQTSGTSHCEFPSSQF